MPSVFKNSFSAEEQIELVEHKWAAYKEKIELLKFQIEMLRTVNDVENTSNQPQKRNPNLDGMKQEGNADEDLKVGREFLVRLIQARALREDARREKEKLKAKAAKDSKSKKNKKDKFHQL